GLNAALVAHAQRRRIFVMIETCDIIDLEPVRSLAGTPKNFGRLLLREREAAMRALADAQHDDFLACRAHLGRRFAILAVALNLDADVVDRAEASYVAGKIEDQAGLLTVGLASTPADLLHVETGRAGRTQHCDEINMRDIEPVGQNHHADQAGQPPDMEVLDNAITLIARRLAQNHLAIDAASAQRVTYHGGVRNTDAVHQPGTAASEISSNLIAGAFDHAILDGRGLELIGDEFSAALSYP